MFFCIKKIREFLLNFFILRNYFYLSKFRKISQAKCREIFAKSKDQNLEKICEN